MGQKVDARFFTDLAKLLPVLRHIRGAIMRQMNRLNCCAQQTGQTRPRGLPLGSGQRAKAKARGRGLMMGLVCCIATAVPSPHQPARPPPLSVGNNGQPGARAERRARGGTNHQLEAAAAARAPSSPGPESAACWPRTLAPPISGCAPDAGGRLLACPSALAWLGDEIVAWTGTHEHGMKFLPIY